MFNKLPLIYCYLSLPVHYTCVTFIVICRSLYSIHVSHLLLFVTFYTLYVCHIYCYLSLSIHYTCVTFIVICHFLYTIRVSGGDQSLVEDCGSVLDMMITLTNEPDKNADSARKVSTNVFLITDSLLFVFCLFDTVWSFRYVLLLSNGNMFLAID